MKTKTAKLFTLIALAVGFATAATAATPVAVWEGDFSTTTKGSYTLDVNDNTVAQDGSVVTIDQDKGVAITATGTSPFGAACSTVIVKFSGYSNPASGAQLLLASTDSNPVYHGIAAQANGNAQAYWNTGLWSSGKITDGSFALGGTAHKLAIVWRRDNGTGTETQQGTKFYLDDVQKAYWSGLYGNYSPDGVAVGGPIDDKTIASGVTAATGMKIAAIAVFNSALSAADIAAYQFPSEKKPLVVWSKDLAAGSVKNGFTMTFGNNAAASFGKAVLTGKTSGSGHTGVAIDWNTSTFNGQTMTVLVKYSGMTQSGFTGHTALLATYWGESNKSKEILLNANSGAVKLAYNVTSGSSGNNDTYWSLTAPSAGLLCVHYSSTGIRYSFLTEKDGVWTTTVNQECTTVDGLKKSAPFYGIKVGGTIAGTGSYYRPGMTVEGVAVYGSEIGPAELTNYDFDVENVKQHKRVAWNTDLADGSRKGKFTMNVARSEYASAANGIATVIQRSKLQDGTECTDAFGVKITWPRPEDDAASFTGSNMTVLVKYSNASFTTSNTGFFSSFWGDESREFVYSYNNKVRGTKYVDSSGYYNSQLGESAAYTIPKTAGLMLMTMKSDGSTAVAFADASGDTYGDFSEAQSYTSSDTGRSNASFYGIKICGSLASFNHYFRAGMTISAVAILDGAFTAANFPKSCVDLALTASDEYAGHESATYATTIAEAENNFTAITWTPTMTGLPYLNDILNFTNNEVDDATVTFNKSVEAGKIALASTAEKDLTLANAGSLTVGTLEAGSGSTLYVDGDVGMGSNLTVDGAGTVEFNGKTFASGKTLTVNGTAAGGMTFASGAALVFGSNGAMEVPSGKTVAWNNTINNAKHRELLAKTTGDGTLQMSTSGNTELQIHSDSTPLTANVNVEYTGSGELHFVGTYRANVDKYTVSAGKTVSFANGTMWAKRSTFVLDGAMVAKKTMIGHEGGAYPGALTVNDGGSLKTESVTVKSYGGSVKSVMNVNAGGVVEFTQNSSSAFVKAKDNSLYEFNLNGGTLKADASSWQIGSGIAINVAADSAVAVSSGKTVQIGGTLSGEGGLTISGAGTTKLTGANTYAGDTVVEAGTLKPRNATALGTGAVTVGADATLSLDSYRIANTVTVNGNVTLKLSADEFYAGQSTTLFKSEQDVSALEGKFSAIDANNADVTGTVSKDADNNVVFVIAVDRFTQTLDADAAINWTDANWTKNGEGEPCAPTPGEGRVGTATVTLKGDATITLPSAAATSMHDIRFLPDTGVSAATVTLKYVVPNDAVMPTEGGVLSYTLPFVAPTLGTGVTVAYAIDNVPDGYLAVANGSGFVVVKKSDSISIKMTPASDSEGKIALTDENVGAYKVAGALWNHTKTYTGTGGGTTEVLGVKDGNGEELDTRVFYYMPNMYDVNQRSKSGRNKQTTGNGKLTYSYFDDSNRTTPSSWPYAITDSTLGTFYLPESCGPTTKNLGWEIGITNIPYQVFDLYIYHASDQTASTITLLPMAVKANDGEWKFFKGDGAGSTVACTATDTWNGAPYCDSATLTEGSNYIRYRFSPDVLGLPEGTKIEQIFIGHPSRSDVTGRLGLAGIQIVKVASSGVYKRKSDAAAGSANWTAADTWISGGATATWANPEGTEVAYAQVDADNVSHLTVDDAINATLVTVTSTSEKPLTLDGSDKLASPIDLLGYTGTLTLSADVEGTITLNSGITVVFNNAEAVSGPAYAFADSATFKKTGAGNYTLNATGVTGMTIEEGTLTLGADCTISGTIDVKAGATLDVNGKTLSGVTITGAGTVKMDTLVTPAWTWATGDSAWTGTCELPSIEAAGLNLNAYGTSASKVKIAGITSGYLNPANAAVNPELVLDGNINITAMSPRDYSFAKVSGAGNISFATSGDQPSSITLTDVSGLTSGTICNNTHTKAVVHGSSFTGLTFTFDITKTAVGVKPFAFDDGVSQTVTVTGESDALAYDATTGIVTYKHKLGYALTWLPIGDSITEGEQYMGHPGEGSAETRGGYRYQVYNLMTNNAMTCKSVGFRVAHNGTLEDPATCGWALHGGIYGALIAPYGNNYGSHLFNVESTLEAAGYPDVITIMLGINDLSFLSSDAEEGIQDVFDSWAELVSKYATLRPNSKVVATTLLPVVGSNKSAYRFGPFNMKVRAAAQAGTKPFDKANVIFADVALKAFQNAYASGYWKGDGVHPNETGSRLVAEAFMTEGFEPAIKQINAAANKAAQVHNGGAANTLTVRFAKPVADVTAASVTLTGTPFGESASRDITSSTYEVAADGRSIAFTLTEALKNGAYTALAVAVNGVAVDTTGVVYDIVGTGVADNVKPSYYAGMQKYQTITIENGETWTTDDRFTLGSKTVTTEEGAISTIKRVGYYMELKRAGEPAQFVWVSMNAGDGSIFGNTLAKAAFPTTEGGAVWGLAGGVTVYGNRGNFTKDVQDSTAVVAFTPKGYKKADLSTTGYPAEGYPGAYGWNDDQNNVDFGSMQVARITGDTRSRTTPEAEMLFAFNGFNASNPCDVGIGTFVTHRADIAGSTGHDQSATGYDWTFFTYTYRYTKFALNAYEVKKIEIWVEKAAEYMAEVSAAGDYTLSDLISGTPTADDYVTITVKDNVAGNVKITVDDTAIKAYKFAIVSAGNATVELAAAADPTGIKAWDFSGAVGRVMFDFPTDFSKVTKGTHPYYSIGYTYKGTIQSGYEYLGAGNILTNATISSGKLAIGGSGTLNGDLDVFGSAEVTLGGTYTSPDNDVKLACSKGTLTIAEGADISVTSICLVNSGDSGNNAIVNINGKLTVTSSCGSTVYGQHTSHKGILFAHYYGKSAVTVGAKGQLIAENSWIQMTYTSTSALTIDGGTVKVLGINPGAKSDTPITVQNGGTLSLKEGLANQDKGVWTFDNGILSSWGGSELVWTAATTAGEGNMKIDATAGDIVVSGAIAGEGKVEIVGGNVVFMASSGITIDNAASKVTVTSGKALFVEIIDINGLGTYTVPAKYEDPSVVRLYYASGKAAANQVLNGRTITYTWEYAGKVCDWDYNFEGNLTSEGSDTTTMSAEGTTPYYDTDNKYLNVGYATPYRGGNYAQEFTAILYGKMVKTAKHLEVGFGSTTTKGTGASSPYSVSIACGDNPENNEVKLLISEGFTVKKTVDMTVPNAYTAFHLYAFTCSTVNDGGTDKTIVKVYLDGDFYQQYKFDNVITLGAGFQIGSVHGGKPTGYEKATTADDGAYLDFLRLYDVVLSDAAMKKYANEYQYVSANGTATRTFDGTAADWCATEAWQQKVGETVTTQDKPNANTVIDISASVATKVTFNLDEVATYEKMSIGTGSAITFKKGGTVTPSVAGITSLGANLTVEYGAIDFGNINILDNITLTYDFTGFPITDYYKTTTIVLTKGMVTKSEGAALAMTGMPESAGRTATIGINDKTGQAELTITVTPAPFIFTIAQGAETGVWSWHGQTIDASVVAEQTSGAIEKMGNGVAALAPQAGFTYDVKEGTLKFSSVPTSACAITNVAEGATFDLNGLSTTVDANVFTVVLNGGTLANTGSELGVVKYLTVLADSEVSLTTGSIAIQSKQGGWGATTIALGTHKLTLNKTGDTASRLELVTTTVTGTGTVDVESGTLWIQENSTFGEDVVVKVGANGVFQLRDDQAKTATVANVEGVEGGKLIASNGNFSGFNLTGTIELAGTGGYGTITNAADAVAKVGTRRDLTFAGAGSIKAQFTAAHNPGDTVPIFNVADSATTGIAELKDASGNVIDSSCYTLSNGTVIFKKEAAKGTIYYFTLKQAVEEQTGSATIELVADITDDEAITVGQAITLEGGTNILSGASFSFNNGGTLALNTGCIGIGWTDGMSASGCCRFNEAGKTGWTDHGPSGYEIATLSAAVREGYKYEFVKSGFVPSSSEQLVPVANADGTDAGAIKLKTDWVAEKTGETDPQKQAVALNTKQGNNLMKWENAILGLDGTKEESKPVVAPVQTATADAITFKLGGVNVDTDSGATVTYKVYGSTDKSSWTAASDETAYNATASVALPTSGVKYYKFEVIAQTSK